MFLKETCGHQGREQSGEASGRGEVSGELLGWWPASGRGRYGGMEEGWAIFITWAGLGDELAVEVEERQTGRARQGALLQRAEAAPRSPSLSPMRAPSPPSGGMVVALCSPPLGGSVS